MNKVIQDHFKLVEHKDGKTYWCVCRQYDDPIEVVTSPEDSVEVRADNLKKLALYFGFWDRYNFSGSTRPNYEICEEWVEKHLSLPEHVINEVLHSCRMSEKGWDIILIFPIEEEEPIYIGEYTFYVRESPWVRGSWYFDRNELGCERMKGEAVYSHGLLYTINVLWNTDFDEDGEEYEVPKLFIEVYKIRDKEELKKYSLVIETDF
ncbi:hypothetical protein [Paenibacillus phage SV21]|nr:hypothetical protein [Paenibacillus phage SV21]